MKRLKLRKKNLPKATPFIPIQRKKKTQRKNKKTQRKKENSKKVYIHFNKFLKTQRE